MLGHGYYQTELLKSNIISILKDRTASLSNSDNYTGISLFNSTYKLYDYVIIELFNFRFFFYQWNAIWFQREPLYHDVHSDTKRSNSELYRRT